jgi:hypothetical protein
MDPFDFVFILETHLDEIGKWVSKREFLGE